MDLKALLERSGLTVSGEPPEVTVAIVGESVPVLVQSGDGDLVECVVALGGGSVPADEADRVALDAAGDTVVEQVEGLLRITRRLSLPTQSELYDALHDVARCAVVLARADDGSSATTFQAASSAGGSEPEAPSPPDAPPPPDVSAPSEAATEEVPPPPAAPDPEATVATAMPMADEPLFWFYVDTPQPILSGDASRSVLATLQPGNWYRGLEEVGEWVRAADDNGVEGWLGANVVRRQ